MADELDLKLDANSARFVAGVEVAIKSLERLRVATANTRKQIAATFASFGGVGAPAAVAFNTVGVSAGKASARVTKATKKVKVDLKGTSRAAATTAAATSKSFDKIGRSATKAGKAVSVNFAGAMRAAMGSVRSEIFSSTTAFVGLAVGAVGAGAVKFAGDFEKSLANVGTLLDDTSVSVERYSGQLLALSKVSSKQLIDITKGLYQAISAGIPSIEGAGGAMDVLTQAVKAAEAGLSTTEESVNAFVTVLNAYKGTGLTAAKVSDQLFETVKKGRTTFPELAHSLGRVATTASTFGVSTQELLAATSTLTKAGLSTDQAMTALQATILGLARAGTKEAREGFQKLGIDASAAGLKTNGLVGQLEKLTKATGGDADALKKLFPNIRALRGVAILAGKGFNTFSKDLDFVTNSAGATERALGQFEGTFSKTFDLFKSQVQATLVEVGNRVLPEVTAGFKSFGASIVASQDEIADAFRTAFDVFKAFVLFMKENGATVGKLILVMFAIKPLIAFIAAVKAAGKAIKVFAAESAVAGAAASSSFMGSFRAGLKGLGPLLGAALRSPTFLAVAVAAAVFLGDAIGNAIGKAATASYRVQQAALEKEISARNKVIDATLRARGFKGGWKQFKKEEAEFESGRVISGAGGKFEAGAQLSPSLAVKSFGIAGAREAAEETAGELRVRASKVNTDQFLLTSRLDDLVDEQKKLWKLADRERLKDLISQEETTRGQIKSLEQRRLKLVEGAATVLETTELAISAYEAEVAAGEAAEKAKKRLGAKSGASEADRQAARANAVRLRLLADTEALALEAREGALDAEVAAFDDATDRQVASLEKRRAKEAEVADFVRARTEERARFIDKENELVSAQARVELATAKEAFQKASVEFQNNLDVRKAATEKFAQEISLIEERAAQQREANRRRQEAAQAKADKEAAEARGRAFTARLRAEQAAYEEKEEARNAPRERGAVERGAAEYTGQGAQGALGTLASIPGPVGAIAGAVQIAMELPGILDDLSTVLETGIADFLGDFDEAVFRFLNAIGEGLPDQLEKVFSEVLPAIIERGVAEGPKIVLKIIAAIPRIIFSIITNLPTLFAAIVRGTISWIRDLFGSGAAEFIGALGSALGDFFSTFFGKLVDAFTAIGSILTRAFDEIIAHIARALGFDEGGPVGDFLKGPFTSAASFKRILTGEGSVDDVFEVAAPGLGKKLKSFFFGHSGGIVRAGASDAVGAARMALSGARAYADGGIVAGGISPGVRDRLSRSLNGDDVPSILQAGEGVLQRAAMNALGEDRFNAINRQDSAALAPPQVTVNVNSRGGRDLMGLVIKDVSADVADSTGSVRRSIDRTRRTPLMTSFVPRRG